jgi:hypothetical protein
MIYDIHLKYQAFIKNDLFRVIVIAHIHTSIDPRDIKQYIIWKIKAAQLYSEIITNNTSASDQSVSDELAKRHWSC